MIDPYDVSNPRNHYCDKCGAAPRQLCRTSIGRFINKPEKQHDSRKRKADQAARKAQDE